MSGVRLAIFLLAILFTIFGSHSSAMTGNFSVVSRNRRAAAQKRPMLCLGDDCDDYDDYDDLEKKRGSANKQRPKPISAKTTTKPHPHQAPKLVPKENKPTPARLTPKPAQPHGQPVVPHGGNKHPATTKHPGNRIPSRNTTPKQINPPEARLVEKQPPAPFRAPPIPPTTTITKNTPTTNAFVQTAKSTSKPQLEEDDFMEDVMEDCDDPELCRETPLETDGTCSGSSCGEALFVTPYLESGEISAAVQKAKVSGHPELAQVPSYSGLFTVNKKFNSSMFFWFFPAMNKETSSPLIVWLQGDVGTSTLFGIFSLHGPYKLTKDLQAKKRKHAWTQAFNILYLDNPVGTGFSFTNKVEGYTRSQEDVAEDLYSALQQFYRLFPDFRDNSVYICGESYGGKYAAALAFKIHTMGEESMIDLKGIALGNPFVDPETMSDYSPFLYHLGLLDEDQAQGVHNIMGAALRFVHRKQWSEAKDAFEEFFGDPYGKKSNGEFYFPKLTGMSVNTHLLRTKQPINLSQYKSFAIIPNVRKAIHVGNLKFQTGEECAKYLREDFAQSVKPWITTLLNHYRMMIYSGNMDIFVAYPLVLNLLHSVKWKHADDFSKSTRLVWKVQPHDDHVAGYVHHVKNFYEVMVKNAGHNVPYDQPRAAMDMISRFIWGRAFNTED